MLCQMKSGTLSTKKLSLPLNCPVTKLFTEAASFSNSTEERLVLSYQGRILSKGDNLDVYEVSDGGLIMVAEIAPVKSEVKPEPAQLSGDEIRKFAVSFKTALKSPSFSTVVKRLQERENMESLAAACPGLSHDLVARSFLTKPDLLAQLCDPETLTSLAKTHPVLLEAANNLAAAVHEEQQSAGRSRLASQGEAGTSGAGAGASGGSYYLDEMSDEEMEAEDGGQAGQRGPRSAGGITPAQLAQALAMAAGMGGGGGGGFSPFQGVTGLGVGSGRREESEEGRSQSRSQSQSVASTPASGRITSNMFQQAMQQALMSSVASQGGQGGQDNQPGQSADSDLTSKVDRMREMGIVDEALAIQALQIMGGDLQAAVDLIFSGWEGGDEAMS